MSQTVTPSRTIPLPVQAGPAPALAASSRGSVWPLLGLVFLAAALALPLTSRDSAAFGTLSTTFVSIVLEAMPFIALGAILGGIIEVYVSRERVAALLPKRRVPAIFAAGLLGLLIPVCECAIIPVTRRLLGKGVPFSAAVAYLLAGPIVNPLVAASTAVAYAGDWLVVALRLGVGYAVAVCVAMVIDRLFPGTAALLDGRAPAGGHECCGAGSCSHDQAHQEPRPSRERLMRALDHAVDDFLYVGQFLVVGAFFAAVAQTLIERQALVELAEIPALAIGLMMGLAVLLNLCSEADAFVAASFRGVLPLAAQLGFLVLGPMLDLKLAAMYLGFVTKRAFGTMVLLMIVLVFAAMMAIQLTLGGTLP